LPEFLFHFTHSSYYYNWVKGMLRAGAQPNINAKEYSKIPLPQPSIEEQKKICMIMNTMDNEIEKESNHKEELETLKKGLMQVLLTGKIRVAV
jgi:type I restriction enzyme S subunit